MSKLRLKGAVNNKLIIKHNFLTSYSQCDGCRIKLFNVQIIYLLRIALTNYLPTYLVLQAKGGSEIQCDMMTE